MVLSPDLMGQSGTGLAAVTLEQAGHITRALPIVQLNCATDLALAPHGWVTGADFLLKTVGRSSDEATGVRRAPC